jgi:hypothetical protein
MKTIGAGRNDVKSICAHLGPYPTHTTIASTATCALQENLSAKFGANPDTAVAFNHKLLFFFKATYNATRGNFVPNSSM